jgi:predicted RNA binding protein YcfA (HicA-like mRNA interferase family)
MNYRELTKKLQKLRCEFVHQAPGSHEVWWNPQNRAFTTIPCHGSKDIPKGTVAAILRDLDIAREDVDKV